jgi:hypothetical protein
MFVTRRTVAVGFSRDLLARAIEMLLMREAGTAAACGHGENGITITRRASQHDHRGGYDWVGAGVIQVVKPL